MTSGGHVDRIAGEFGVHFIDHTKRVKGRHQSKARRTCQTLLKNYGPEHLRLVFGLINTTRNRGNWVSQVFTAVSWLILNRPELVERSDFLTLFDQLDLDALLASAKRANRDAPTVTMTVLLSYKMDELTEATRKEKAA
ncbi:hypothetical protein [Roseibium sediminis]|uniref:hypothetical protein n=1 Tax=Roseibium sediminis TaxID=1775174 RepID=UPI00123CAA43|nr:hypothetical protein [Roseibium sediminis]